jgi:hypothetical protein
MSVSRSFSTLSPYYVYKAFSAKSLGFGNTKEDGSTIGTTLAASPTVMIASSQGSTLYDIWYTSDAKNWTRSSSAASVFGTNRIQSMCFGNDIFVAVGNNMVIATSPSTDGGTWTARTKAAGARAGAVARRVHFLNNKFFIWDEDGYIQKSTDGITWTGVANIGDNPTDGDVNGGSSTIIYNSSNSSLYAFPDNYELAVDPQTRFFQSSDDFATKTTWQYSGSNGIGARFVHARNVDGNWMYIGTTGRTSTATYAQNSGGNGAVFIEIPLTTVAAKTYDATGGGSEASPPALWPTTHKIPSFTAPQFTSNGAVSNLSTLFPDYGGAAGSQNGFWVNYENGYWNLIGNVGYAYASGNSTNVLGCMTLRWKADEGQLEAFYAVRSGAVYDGSNALTPKGGAYGFQHRVTQVNGGNEVVFRDKVYICAIRGGSSGYGRVDIIVGSRKVLPLRTAVNY